MTHAIEPYVERPDPQQWAEEREAIRQEVHHGTLQSIEDGLGDVGRLIQEIDAAIKSYGSDSAKTQARDEAIKLLESLKRARTALRKEQARWSQAQNDASFAAD